MARAASADDRWDDQAQRDLRAKLRRARDRPAVLAAKADALARAGDRARLTAALELFEEAVAFGDRFRTPLCLAELAEVRRKLGDPLATLTAYRRAIAYERAHPGVGTQVAARFVAWVLATEERGLLTEASAVMASDGFPAGTRRRLFDPVLAALAETGDAAKAHAARAVAEREFALDQRASAVLDVAYRIACDRPGLARASYVLHPPRTALGEPVATLPDLAADFAVSAHQLDADGAVLARDRLGLDALDRWLRRGPFGQAKPSWLVDYVAPGLGAYLGCVLAAEGARWNLRTPLLTSTIVAGDAEVDVFAQGWAAVFDGAPLTPS